MSQGEAAAATYRHDFGSSFAVVHESESATVDRQAGSGRSLEAQSAGLTFHIEAIGTRNGKATQGGIKLFFELSFFSFLFSYLLV